MKKLVSMLLTITVLLALPACGGAPATPSDPEDFEPINIRMASQHIPNSHGDDAQKRAVEKIAERTEGRVNITIYNNAQLGDANVVFEEVISGSIDMAQITIPEVFDARINAPMLPGLVSTYEEIPGAIGPDSWLSGQLTAMEAELGLQHLSVSPEGLVGVATKKPVLEPAIIGAEHGVQLRVPPNDAFRLPYEALGFRTSTIPYSELYTSIETGIVDGTGAFDPYGTYLYLGDATNHYYDYRLSGEFSQVIMNKALFDRLLPEDQATILEVYDEYFYDVLEGYQVLEEEYLNKMEAESDKWTVIRFSEEERAAFSAVIKEQVWPELAEIYTQEFLDELVANLK